MTELHNPMESGFPELPCREQSLPHELLEVQGYEYVLDNVYPDETAAQRALDAFLHPKLGAPNFANLFDPKSFKIIPYEGGYMIFGKKTVRSAFANQHRGRRSA